MGVSGCGKTTIGKEIAKALGIDFYDADDFHPQSNIDKMVKGIALQDDDRWPWLDVLSKKINYWNTKSNAVLACSALKESYRKRLAINNPDIQWVFLSGTFELIKNRMEQRQSHFMKADLLRSQFKTLETPNYGLCLDINNTVDEIVKKALKELKKMSKSNFGVFGLGVMGKSIAFNLASKGHNLSVYNRGKGTEKYVVRDFLKDNESVKNILGFNSVSEFVNSIQQPRKILLMVNAGATVDVVLQTLLPYLSAEDIIIDGGNSHYLDTKRRIELLKTKGLYFIGCGISGGEEGAKNGPSMMPSGDLKAYSQIAPILESIAAKDKNNKPCCQYIGKKGSGHFVKMAHNGIEYAEMQLLAEVFSIMSKTMTYETIAETLTSWQKGNLSSYLLDITSKILQKKEGNEYVLDLILDQAGNKGTGSWSSKAALELGIPNTMMTSAVFARFISSFKNEREKLALKIKSNTEKPKKLNLKDLKKAYQFARIINHHQGFALILEASNTYSWHVSLSEIARIWTNGCIIKSKFMESCVKILEVNQSFLEDKTIISVLNDSEKASVKILKYALSSRVASPCLFASHDYWVAMSTNKLPANLIQAQRDFFGAHTYKRIDKPFNENFHTNWS